MTVALLGNDAPMMQAEEGNSYPAEHMNQSITRVEMREGFDDEEIVSLSLSTNNDRMLTMIARTLPDDLKHYSVGILEIEQIWSIHSGANKPAWVRSDDEGFAKALADYFECPIGEPVALLTNLGRDNLHSQHLNTAAQPAACNYLGLTANATAPSASNTSLTAEITTAGGGLIRKQATYAHTGGTNTSTLTATFTANGTDALPVTVAKLGVFNHITTAATLCYETLLNATATLNVSGDSVAITETITGG